MSCHDNRWLDIVPLSCAAFPGVLTSGCSSSTLCFGWSFNLCLKLMVCVCVWGSVGVSVCVWGGRHCVRLGAGGGGGFQGQHVLLPLSLDECFKLECKEVLVSKCLMCANVCHKSTL